MQVADFPILEFDPTRRAVIEPSEVYKPIDAPEHCVVCFLKDVVERMAATCGGQVIHEEPWCGGTNPYYRITYSGRPIVVFFPLVGAPCAAAYLEIAIALGCRRFVVCGGAGVLDRSIGLGTFVVPNAAIRDEGLSYKYIPPCRQIEANPRAVAAITATLDAHSEPYRIAKTWTTDAFFRETVTVVARRKAEGCATVEMEAAALMAVAQFRGVELGYILFGGDDVSGTEWDTRSDQPRLPISERLLRLSLEACLRL